MTNRLTYLFALAIGIAALPACVPSKKYNDLLLGKAQLEKDLNTYKETTAANSRELKQLRAQVDERDRDLQNLRLDSARTAADYAKVQQQYQRMNADYHNLLKNSELQLSSSNDEKRELAAMLDAKQQELAAKAQELAAVSAEIDKAQTQLDAAAKALNDKEQNINQLQTQLEAREKRVTELEAIIKRQEEQSKALRTKINNALLGFSAADLTVEQRDGKVYVSLSQNLLFASGSTTLDAKGKDALKKLSEVLKKDTDFDILIEGHTDNVPIRNNPSMKDNWDLSVLRSTSIVRELTTNGVDPKRIIAAGRGEYIPKADNGSSTGRAQNRRSEIILSPKLDELYNVINQ